MRPELESKLLFLSPAEVVAAGPLSSPTRRLLGSFASPTPAATRGGVTEARLHLVRAQGAGRGGGFV